MYKYYSRQIHFWSDPVPLIVTLSFLAPFELSLFGWKKLENCFKNPAMRAPPITTSFSIKISVSKNRDLLMSAEFQVSLRHYHIGT